MRVLILSLMVVTAVGANAQNVEHWWLPERYTGNRHSAMTLHEMPGGMVCMSINDSIHNKFFPLPWESNKFRDLNFYFIDQDGILQANLLRSIGPMASADFYREDGGFDFAVSGSEGGGIHLASTDWHIAGACVGSSYSIRGMRFQYSADASFHTSEEFPSGRNPALLQIDGGVTWLAWESVTVLNPPQYLYKYYEADIRIARISRDHRVEQLFTIGPGYNPRLVQRADGTVFVLYRTGKHAEAPDSVGIRLTAITVPGGGDAILERDLLFPYPYNMYNKPKFEVFATQDNRLIVLFDHLDSVIIYTCTADGNVLRSEAAAAGNEEYQRYLLADADGRVVLLWRKTAGQDITWSPLVEGRMFDTVRTINGTASFMEWKAFKGQDGSVKYIAHPTGSDSLLIIPNATATTPAMHLLFSPPTFWGAVLDWTLDKEDVLWIAHSQELSVGSYHSGLFRVRNLSLSSHGPELVPQSAKLFPNYPNPFNPSTTIQYTLQKHGDVSISVSDPYGREVRRLLDGSLQEAGSHKVNFDANGLPSGIYYYSLHAGGLRLTRKMVLSR